MRKERLMPLNLQFFAEEVADTSANTLDVADPVETVAEEITPDSEESVEEPIEPTVTQSADDNSKYAAARRQAEAEARAKQAETDAWYANQFKGYENPITHQPILSERDYREALIAQDNLRQRQELQRNGIDPDMLERLVNQQVENNPTVKQAQEVMARTVQEQSQKMIEEDMQEIAKLDPSIKSLDDIAGMPNFNEIIDLVQNKNLRLSQAYKLVNMDSLIGNKTNAAKQAAINNMRGTQHLTSTNGVSVKDDGLQDIPQKELATWKEAFPEASYSELKKKYNNTL